jgi:two-component system sensor histidine kinase UhpB
MNVVALPTLDLKWSLTLRVMAATVISYSIAVAFTLVVSYRDTQHSNERVAEIVARQLQTELFRIDSHIALPAQFPDWDPIIALVQTPGQCIQYIKPNGRVGRANCTGIADDKESPPAWFSTLAAGFLAPRAEASRPIAYRGRSAGTLLVTTDPAAILATIWKSISGLIDFTALVVIATCVLQYITISRALRPTKDILQGLDRLARGDLSCRLPRFKLVELQRISDVFNSLAENLNFTMRERSALAAKLVDGQEQERRHLARELHDELAQTLSAMSAVAASIRATAELECASLVPAANSLSQTAIAMTRFLRTTLRTLRPPEIDDLGLAASLSALAREHERRANGTRKIALEIDGALQDIPPTAASHLYRIVQEGLTNIAKHTNASQAYIKLTIGNDWKHSAKRCKWLTLVIEDNGCGYADDRMHETGCGLGLIGMRERVTALGGQLDVIHPPYQGFKLKARIPFETSTELVQ